jgi:hypothetical protein
VKWERKHGLLAAGVLLLSCAFLAYRQCEKGEHPGTDAGIVEQGPAAKVPSDLIAEVYVSSPNATWTKLQRGIGGALGILPMTAPGVIVALSDLDVMLSGELDGTSPIHAALSGDPADPEWAIAMKLVDGRRARGLLIDGDTARFGAKEEPGMTLLVPKRVASPGEQERQVAITTNGWLLVTRDAKGLGPLGTWVTRGLTAQPPPTLTSAAVIDVPRAALTSTLTPKLKELWGSAKEYLTDEDRRMRAERGRAPDFGEPAAILAALDGFVNRRIAIVGDFEKVRITLEVTDDAISAHAVLTAAKAGEKGENAARVWIDAMSVGDTQALLQLPSTAPAALSMRDAEPTRKEQAESLKTTLASVLGPRLKDPAPLHKVIDAATKARGDVITVAIGMDDPSGNFVRLPIRDAEAATSAATAAVELAKSEPFKDLLRAQSVTTKQEEISGEGNASVAMVTHVKPDAGPPKRDSGVAWLLYDNQHQLLAGVGTEPAATLRAGLKDKKLADLAVLKHFLDAIGNDASTVLIAQPLKMDARRSALPGVPAGLAIGKKDDAAFVHLEVPDVLLRELSRRQLGL